MVPADTTRKKAFRLSRLFDSSMVAFSVFGGDTWVLHESEAFICKALKGKAIGAYADPLITPQMKASGSPAGGKLIRLIRPSSFLLTGYIDLLHNSSQHSVIYYYPNLSLIFMQDSGSTWIMHDSGAGISMLILTLKQAKSESNTPWTDNCA
jgi:hypothetical protein